MLRGALNYLEKEKIEDPITLVGNEVAYSAIANTVNAPRLYPTWGEFSNALDSILRILGSKAAGPQQLAGKS